MHFARAVLVNFEIAFSPAAIVGETANIKPARTADPMPIRLHGLTQRSFAERKRCDKSGMDHGAENWKS
jgi:hypothetical protein